MIEIKVTSDAVAEAMIEIAKLATLAIDKVTIGGPGAAPEIKAPAASAPAQPTEEAAPLASTPAPVSQVPIAPSPSYTLAQVAKAGADLMRQSPGLQPALEQLIKKYGVQTVAELPQDKLGAFATELRQMGAQL